MLLTIHHSHRNTPSCPMTLLTPLRNVSLPTYSYGSWVPPTWRTVCLWTSWPYQQRHATCCPGCLEKDNSLIEVLWCSARDHQLWGLTWLHYGPKVIARLNGPHRVGQHWTAEHSQLPGWVHPVLMGLLILQQAFCRSQCSVLSINISL